MRLISDQTHQFEPLAIVRDRAGLPADFSLGTILDFSPPERPFWRSLERVATIQEKLLASVPGKVTPANLPPAADQLAAVMRAELVAVATSLGITIEEIDTVVLDFYDLLMPGIYALIEYKLNPTAGIPPDPEAFVKTFLDNTSYWGGEAYVVPVTDGTPAQIVVAYDHFGPFGFRITVGEEEPLCAADDSLADPVGGPLQRLAIEVLEALFEI